ncbi:dihydropteroate synthase [Klenkia sp. PcliD-1-E]|uniref:dihydropteroate synthase n=1 Tax=Klenkia sp. PcliD-1-E TaxID=2954492 RepID=UPI002096A350|nr:dihydropteroate synthase [Klenkia sp. PcliD-1-E]MCO7220857.1 dihydropteroate synthase [Klenkia sp. PcliD-1-E]
MIDLRALARLAAEHEADLDHAVEPFRVGDRVLDTDVRPAIMGVVNLSQDSSYRESVAPSTEAAVRRGKVLTAQGADVVDVGAESVFDSAARVGPQDQIRSLVPVVEELADAGVAVSVESYDPVVARAALAAGAQLLNLTGSADDDAVFELAAEFDAALVICNVLGVNPRELDDADVDRDPYPAMAAALGSRVAAARDRGVRAGVAVDPGAGFGMARLTDPLERVRHQSVLLLQSFRLRSLGVPVCHSLPSGFSYFEDEVRTAEGFFAVLAGLGGTGIHRTHEVPRVRAVLRAMADLPVDHAPGLEKRSVLTV